jgi:mannose/fructose-specific phosphotransferase system component IIA
MSDLIGVVVTHGGVAEGMVDAAERITGLTGVLLAISNEGCGMDDLGERIDNATKGKPSVVFVDMPVGSCLQAAARVVRTGGDRAMVAGVNLPMLLDFCFHRDSTASEAALRAVDKGLAAIKTLGT